MRPAYLPFQDAPNIINAMRNDAKLLGAAAALLILSTGLHSQGTPIPVTFASDGSTDAVSAATTDGTSAATEGADAGSSATPAGSSGKFLGFKSRESFHRFSGWMSGGLLLGAGVVGAVHGYQMMTEAHKWRDDHGIEEEDTDECGPEINRVWKSSDQQALRWTHVGLLVAGETFYFADAFTGASFMRPLPPGWSKAKIHRYAFFAHAGLMVAEGVLGFLTTDALKDGDHERMTGLLAAHTAIGFAIPVVILGSGAIMSRPRAEP
jgi:hypothetical protein